MIGLIVDKRVMAVTVKVSPEDLALYQKAKERLYGKDAPVTRSSLIRELANRAARQILKKKAKARR